MVRPPVGVVFLSEYRREPSGFRLEVRYRVSVQSRPAAIGVFLVTYEYMRCMVG